jgi:AcrR family transcriptional regulator
MVRSARATAEDDASPGTRRQRWHPEQRRTALLDAATGLLAQEGIEAVSMDTVATRADVSRPLVYKHFANRDELLAEVYRREAAKLDAAIVAAVEQAHGFDAKIRAMIRALLDAETTHAPIFTPLLRAGLRDARFRKEQRDRDRRTVRFFARLAMDEFDLGKAEATAAVAVLLTGMESVQAQWRSHPAAERHAFLEDLYVGLVRGGLASLARRSAGASEAG